MLTTNATNTKAPGTIGTFFDSLSGTDAAPLPKRFAELKKRLISTPEDEINLVAGWKRLLVELKENNPKWAERGNTVRLSRLRHQRSFHACSQNIPVISYRDLIHGDNNSAAAKSVLGCGSVIIKGAVSRETALAWKEAIREYIKQNPKAKGRLARNVVPRLSGLTTHPRQATQNTIPKYGPRMCSL